MAAVAALLDTRAAALALRRTLPGGPGPAVVPCRTPGGLRRACRNRLLDAVVIGPRALRDLDLPAFHRDFPALPVLAFGAFRSDDGGRLLDWLGQGWLAGVGFERVDDPVVGVLVRRHAASRARAAALTEAPRLLRLQEPLQRRAWQWLALTGGPLVGTAEVAEALGVSREHLSRQFAAGGAPNLKRVIDLLRVVVAAELLASPGHDARSTAKVLGFGTVSHFRAVSRRVTGLAPEQLRGLSPMAVVRAFARVGMRSRGQPA